MERMLQLLILFVFERCQLNYVINKNKVMRKRERERERIIIFVPKISFVPILISSIYFYMFCYILYIHLTYRKICEFKNLDNWD